MEILKSHLGIVLGNQLQMAPLEQRSRTRRPSEVPANQLLCDSVIWGIVLPSVPNLPIY